MSARTPGPYRIGDMTSVTGITLWRNDGDNTGNAGYKRICRNVCDQATAEFIVTACNVHDEWAQTLRRIAVGAERALKMGGAMDWRAALGAVSELAQDALAKVRS